MKRLFAWLPDDPRHRWLAVGLLAILLLERLGLILGQPDLLHDLDAAELKHMDLVLYGLQEAPTWQDKLLIFLSGPENVHHGGYPTASVLYLVTGKILGYSLTVLRLQVVVATLGAACLMAAWLKQRVGPGAALMALALLVGGPPLFLKWTATTRGGHLEVILFLPLLLVLLEQGLSSDRRWPWLAAGIAGGFAVYLSYLSIPLVVVVALGASVERIGKGGWASRIGLLVLGGLVGFLPWLLGLLVLEMPYLEATIHQSGNPEEALEVRNRGVLQSLAAAFTHLDHNLWPWTVTRADAPAYQSAVTDMMDFTPTAWEWVVRAVIGVGAIVGIWAAVARRSGLMLAVALLPAVHYLFVIRLANPLAWPDVPHRYLTIVFPAVVASIGFGVHHLVTGEGVRRRIGQVLATLLALVALQGFFLHACWMRVPDPGALASYDVQEYRHATLGQVRLHEGAGLNELLEGCRGEDQMDCWRGLGLIYPPISDYYLLFRADDARPYPSQLFNQRDPLATTKSGRTAMVRAAYDATLLRVGDDPGLVRDRLCSWRPGSQFKREVQALFEQEGVSCPGR